MQHVQQPLAGGWTYLTGGVLNGSFGVGGTWSAYSTWVLPAFTLGGTVTSNGQSFSGTIANLGTVTTVDLNGGTIDGTTQATGTINGAIAVGGSWTAAAAWTLPALTLGGTVTSNGQSFSGTIANLGSVSTVDLNGGTIDGTTQSTGTINGPISVGGTWTAVAALTMPSFSTGTITFDGSVPSLCVGVENSALTLYGGTAAGIFSATLELVGKDSGGTDAGGQFRLYARTDAASKVLTGDPSGTLTWGGSTIWTAANDGAGSGLDADLLDGQSGAYYLAASSYTAADVLAKLLTVDGSTSGLDADLLDGKNTGTSGNTVPLLDGTNTWSNTQTFPSVVVTGLTDLSGASAGQIKFPATMNASANANTLDDYEENTWTPTISATSGTFTTTSSSGRYQKIGNRVYWYAAIIITNKGTATGTLSFTLPFTNTQDACGWGREVALNNKVVSSQSASGTGTTDIIYYDNTTAIVDATQYRVQGFFEV